MSTIKAGVIVKTRFINKAYENTRFKSKGLETFKGYIDYMDRNESIRNDNFNKFSMYNDYMGNPNKTTGLFTSDKDNLSSEEIKSLKQGFLKSYDNDGVMWQTVISFDNRFLAQVGVFDPKTNTVNIQKLQDVTRDMMTQMLKLEGMEHTAIWSGAIHFNTDNIHIHIATVEPIPTRTKFTDKDGQTQYRGKLKPKTMSAMKSKVVNKFLERDRTYLNELVRNRMVAGKKTHNSLHDIHSRELFSKIYSKLPTDRRKWYYNMNSLNDIRPLIDSMSREYINSHHKDDFNEFKKKILEEQATFKQAYGENSNYKNYAQNKIDDLYARMGNVILSQMREYAKTQDLYNRLVSPSHSQNISHNRYSTIDFSIRKIAYALNSEYKQKSLNQHQHEQLLYDMDK